MEKSNETTQSWKQWKVTDIIYGIVIPFVIGLLIIAVSMVSSPSLVGLKYPLLEAIVIIGVPMLIGLIWNQWAGGASGFLLGSLYTLYYADQLYATRGYSDLSLIGNLVSAMLIGYTAGALSKRSDNYKRMIIAGITAGIMGSFIILVCNQFSTIVENPGVGGAVLVILPRILAGVIVPLVARAFLRQSAK